MSQRSLKWAVALVVCAVAPGIIYSCTLSCKDVTMALKLVSASPSPGVFVCHGYSESTAAYFYCNGGGAGYVTIIPETEITRFVWSGNCTRGCGNQTMTIYVNGKPVVVYVNPQEGSTHFGEPQSPVTIYKWMCDPNLSGPTAMAP
jgi:hypothetical protein